MAIGAHGLSDCQFHRSPCLFTIAMFELEPNSLLKRISSRCFQDYNLNPWVRGFVYVFAILYLFFLAINF